jgi:hypothetical protein
MRSLGPLGLADLITRYGRDEKLFAFTDDITATANGGTRAATTIRAEQCARIYRKNCSDNVNRLPNLTSGWSAPLGVDRWRT